MSDALELYAPTYLLEEFAKHEHTILKKTYRTHDEFGTILDAYRELISFIDQEAYEPLLDRTVSDPDDADYIALVRCIDCPIWSNDAGLKEQQHVAVITTSELIAAIYPEESPDRSQPHS